MGEAMPIKISILDKEELVYAILWFIAALAFALLIIIPVKQLKNAKKIMMTILRLRIRFSRANTSIVIKTHTTA